MRFSHDLYTDLPALNFIHAHLLDSLFYPIRARLDGRDTDRPLLARLLEASQNLRPIERLPPPILLHHHGETLFDPLIRGVPALAREAFAAAADDLALLAHPRIHDFILDLVAERAFHRTVSFSDYRRVVGVEDRKTTAEGFRLLADFPLHARVLRPLEHSVNQRDDLKIG